MAESDEPQPQWPESFRLKGIGVERITRLWRCMSQLRAPPALANVRRAKDAVQG